MYPYYSPTPSLSIWSRTMDCYTFFINIDGFRWCFCLSRFGAEQLGHPKNNGFGTRRATGYINIHRNDLIDPAHHVIAAAERRRR